MKTTDAVPFEKWPWWVKLIVMPMKNNIKSEKKIILVIIILFIVSFDKAWDLFGLNSAIFKDKIELILIFNGLILILWQVLATMWIRENSTLELIKVNTLKRILAGLFLLLIFIAIPVILALKESSYIF